MKQSITLKKVFAAVFLVLPLIASPAAAGLAARIDSIINRQSQQNAQYSISVADAQTGEVLYSQNDRQAMIPASNMKIITSAAAVHYLGADYEYVTRVGLWGDRLVIIGSGDPLLGDDVTDRRNDRKPDWLLLDIVEKLKAAGVTSISDIIVDSTVFDDRRVHPSWPVDQLNRWYACEVSGVNYHGNCIDITARNVGGRVILDVMPDTNYVNIRNDITAVNSGDQAVGSYRTNTPNRIIAFGRCRTSQGPFKVAIERPAAFFGFLVYEQLVRSGIEVTGELLEKSVTPGRDFDKIAEYRTPLADVLLRCNEDSLNLAAEALMKTIAANVPNDSGAAGSWQRGSELMSEYLAWLGINPEQYHIDDGSGLSRENRLSATAIKRALLNMHNSGNWQLYKQSLAVAGESGTINRYFHAEPYRGNIVGKTGYIRGVRSFSGVCTVNGKDYIFAALANNSNANSRTALNDIAKAIIDEFSG